MNTWSNVSADEPTPPTEDQIRMARAVLSPLTDTQRRAVIAVVAWETVQELELELAGGAG